ncbi:transcriptional regulator, partial [Rhizobiaceae sp. 2RAB30]
ARNFDGAFDEVFDFQDRITEAVATVVEPHIKTAEIERSRRERPASVAAYDSYLSALSKILAETADENAAAYAMLTKALALEPDNANLLSLAAWALEHRITVGWPPLGADDRERCFELARRGLEKAAGDPTVMA